ncbi:MAG TPA: hypothetical protein VIX89_18035 [Bryobacteraceae bacterium]
MSRLLECVFVLGCAVVGFSMDAKDGSVMQNAVGCSIQLVSTVHDRVASHAARLTSSLALIPARMIGHARTE